MKRRYPEVIISVVHHGEIRLVLYPEIAPNTVSNFISFASKGFYDGLLFHRIIKGYVLQAGDPDGDGMGDPGYHSRGEFTKNGFDNHLRHETGVISMARAFGYDTAGSQFFIIHRDAFRLDGEYAAFGRVIDGMDVVDRIAEVETDYADSPLEVQAIYKVMVDTFGVEYPEPDKI